MEIVRLDWALKHLLRDKANFDVLEGFLAALLKENIVVLDLLESEGNQENQDSKFNRVDILVKDSQERKIIIEVQTEWESGYLERLLFGVSRKIVEHLKVGEPFASVSKVIMISIQYFNLGKGDDYVYCGKNEFRGLHSGNPLVVKERVETMIGEDQKMVRFQEKDIFPEYYLINLDSFTNEVKDSLDEWVYAFKNGEVQESFSSKNIDKLKDKFALMRLDLDSRRRYDRFLIQYAYEKDVIKSARDAGKKEGIDIGKKEGIDIGKKEALTEAIIDLCQVKFGITEIPPESFDGATVDELTRWKEAIKKASQVNDLPFVKRS